MAYSELIKNFENIRDYMRQFYVYGFRSRTEYDAKSARSYDNERRRMESWLGDYMSFRKDADGKRVFLSVDSRSAKSNPLYSAFKARSFTVGDITFHFYIMDLLADGGEYSVGEIMDAFADRYFCAFESARELEESTVRKKLREYVGLGLLRTSKRGRELVYSRYSPDPDLSSWTEALGFFSEAAPLGVVGSYLLDKSDNPSDSFRFKHHYILHAIDSQVMCDILAAMSEKRLLDVTVRAKNSTPERTFRVFPVRIYISTQTGRHYLLCRNCVSEKMTFLRLDVIIRVSAGEPDPEPERYEALYEDFRRHLWGVSDAGSDSLTHIELTVRVNDGEGHILNRLYRERRCGTVTKTGEHSHTWSADVYDAIELIPWLRTFIGRIERLSCSDPRLVSRFDSDLEELQRMYGGDEDAVQ